MLARSDKEKLTHLATQLNLNNSVKFISATDNVAELYSSNADCFISVPTEEVFGLTLAEASLAKLPIITSNVPGIDEIYTDQENALFVSPNNTNELVNAIKSFIETPFLRKKLADSAQKHIIKTFSLKQQFLSFNLAYQALLQHKNNETVVGTVILYSKQLLKASVHKGHQFLRLKLS